jgi:hypothetical protein
MNKKPLAENCKKKKKKGIKFALDTGGETVTVGEQKKSFAEWVKQREQAQKKS